MGFNMLNILMYINVIRNNDWFYFFLNIKI